MRTVNWALPPSFRRSWQYAHGGPPCGGIVQLLPNMEVHPAVQKDVAWDRGSLLASWYCVLALFVNPNFHKRPLRFTSIRQRVSISNRCQKLAPNELRMLFSNLLTWSINSYTLLKSSFRNIHDVFNLMEFSVMKCVSVFVLLTVPLIRPLALLKWLTSLSELVTKP